MHHLLSKGGSTLDWIHAENDYNPSDLLNTCDSLHTNRLLQETMAKREMRFRKRQIAARRKMFAAFSGSGN